MYSQQDPKWADKELGKSGLKMAAFGCVVTAVAQALFNAGHKYYDPGVLLDKLNAVGGFTDNNHPQGAGLLIWAKVQEIEPAFVFGGKGVEFIQGMWGKFSHWVLLQGGQLYDPYYGKNEAPKGFVPTGSKQTASIAVKAVDQPSETPVEVPSENPVPTEPEYIEYIVKSGDTLGQIIVDHYGPMDKNSLWGRNGKVNEISRLNGIKNANLIYPDQKILLPKI